MADPKGDQLFVNLGASQTRRRLKGFGHGVRKVHTAGRNRAVIIHTATGKNLEELTAKFADVGFSYTESDLSEPIENLRNLGPASAAWLRSVGIRNRADVQRLGPVLAFRIVQRKYPRASLNLLWALAGGMEDRDWRDLTGEEKADLKQELESED